MIPANDGRSWFAAASRRGRAARSARFVVRPSLLLSAFCLLASLSGPGGVCGAEMGDRIQEVMTYTVDELGNAQVSDQFQLSAAQWQRWRQSYGDHPDLLRRDILRRFPYLTLSDFRLDRNDLERQQTGSYRVQGLALYRGQGRFQLPIHADFRKITESGREWHFTRSQQTGPDLALEETVKVVLPPAALEIQLSGISDGFQMLTYQMPEHRAGNLLWLCPAALAVLLLVVLTIVRLASSGAAQRQAAAQPVPVPYQPQPQYPYPAQPQYQAPPQYQPPQQEQPPAQEQPPQPPWPPQPPPPQQQPPPQQWPQ